MSAISMTASEQVRAELARLERMWLINQKMNAVMRPVGGVRLRSPDAQSISDHNARRAHRLAQN